MDDTSPGSAAPAAPAARRLCLVYLGAYLSATVVASIALALVG